MRISVLAGSGLALAGTLGPLRAQAPAPEVAAFFKDKQLRLVVGSAAGDGYDVNARLLAHHWVRHIPGNPSIIVQNQNGAASVTMTNTLYNTAARDGTVIGAPINGMTTAPLLTPDVVKFDLAKLIWIGSTNRDTQITYLWHTAPVKSMADLLTTEVVVGGSAPGTTQVDYPVVARALFGLKFKMVSGYPGTNPIHVAMERGEVAGMGANGWLSLKTLNSAWVKEKKVNILLQYGREKNPELPDVPSIFTLARTEADAQALQLMTLRLQYGRPFFLPPDVPPARVAALRRSFDATLADPAFQADAAKAQLDVSPLTGEETARLVAEVLATPPTVVKRVRDALEAGAR